MYNIAKYYDILGVSVGASIDEVKQNYRDLVKIWHPDRFNNDPRLQQKASERLKEINSAYNEICIYINYHNNISKNYERAYEQDNVDKAENITENDYSQVNNPCFSEHNFYEYVTEVLKFIKEKWYLLFLTGLIWLLIIIFLYYGYKPSPSQRRKQLIDQSSQPTVNTEWKPVGKPEPMSPKEATQSANIPATPINPVSLTIGSSPLGMGIKNGNSLLTVENGTSDDALVKVIRFRDTEQKIRNFYIPAGKTYTANKIPQGQYILKVAFGKDWNRKLRIFNLNRHFTKTDLFDIAETKWTESVEDGYVERTRYTKMNITLHKVLHGNFESQQISEEDFNND